MPPYELPRQLRRSGRRFAAAIVLSLSAVAVPLAGQLDRATPSPSLPQGIASGDVTDRSAVLWARASAPAELRFEVWAEAAPEPRAWQRRAQAADDFTVTLPIDGLRPDTPHRYSVSVLAGDGKVVTNAAGRFRTAPPEGAMRPLRFLFSGDLGGQTYCRRRDAPAGYSIFSAMGHEDADFFIANGDMIYGDNPCPEQGPPGWINVPGDFPAVDDPAVDWRDTARTLEVYRAHWRYNRADEAFRRFNATVPMLVQWDDHEVINDFGAAWPTLPAEAERPGYPELVAAGRRAFFEYHPIGRDPEDPDRIYRGFRWGGALELFILDARSYRDANRAADGAEKTMLGKAQLEWLRQSIPGSDATWKIVSTDVPLSFPTGTQPEERGSDAWASGGRDEFSARTGFEAELLALLTELDRRDVDNLVFIATDVHLAMQMRYEVDLDGDGDTLLFWELIAGPLSAAKTPTPRELDTTLRPTILYGEGGIFNYGLVTIEDTAERGWTLAASVRDEQGKVRPGSELVLSPR